MKFDLEKYETVKERKARFYKDNPDGRIIVEQINPPEQITECAEFKAYIYKNGSDQEKGLPWATGHALELRDKDLSISREGAKYESVNYSSWTENAEESAIGRALDNAGYAGAPSREEMKIAEKNMAIANRAKTKASAVPVEDPRDHIDFSSVAKDMKKTSLNKVQNYCTVCGGHVSLAEKKYCIEKKLPIMCYDCQKKKSIISRSELGETRLKAATS